MAEKRRKVFLKHKNAKDLLNQASQRLKLNMEQIFGTKGKVEVMETGFARIFFINDGPLLAEVNGEVFPTLAFKEFSAVSPKVVVDMGAIPFVCKGANIMAPGIRRIEGMFEKGDFVSVVDEKHGKVLALGKVLCGLAAAKEAKHGIVVKNIHFIGDKLWDFIKEFSVAAK